MSRSTTIGALLQGVYPSFALLAGMQLDVFTALEGGPLEVEQLAQRLRVSADKLGPLLYALAAAGLLVVDHGRFANTDEADRMLVRGRPEYLGDSSELLADIWHAALQTADSIRTGAPQAKHDFTTMSSHELETYFRGLHGDALEAGRVLARACDFSGCKTLLDVGGGSAGVAISVTEANPHLRATVVDLPNVTAVTERFIARAGATDRVRAHGLDLVRQPLSGAFDVAVLKSVLQTLSPEQAQQVLRHVSAALAPGGVIYILGAGILDDSRLHPPAAALFNVVFINFYDGGRAYTESEHRQWLVDAGFEGFASATLSNGAPLLSARKPA